MLGLFLVVFDDFGSAVLEVSNWRGDIIPALERSIPEATSECYVLCIELQSISCVENKTYETVKNGLKVALTVWPMRLNKTNVVVSILPLRLALNKLAVIATGKAKEELLTCLGVPTDQRLEEYFPKLLYTIRYARDTSLIMLNRLYVKESDDVAPGFLKDADVFGVQVQKTRFNMPRVAVNAINQWVDAASLKRITDVITEDNIDQSTSMVLINALHIKPTWKKPFDIRLSLVKPFTLLNKKQVMMRMMTKLVSRFFYAENKEHQFQLLLMELDCPECKITFVLPRDPVGLPKLLKIIEEHPDLIPHTMNHIREEFLNVRLPVMKIKTFVNWNPYLKGLGVRQIFDKHQSGLEAISKPNSSTMYHLSKIFSKVFLDIDEFGIHRKAPEGPLDLSSLNDQGSLNQFLAIHPFYFRIDVRDNIRDVFHELFTGVFYGTE